MARPPSVTVPVVPLTEAQQIAAQVAWLERIIDGRLSRLRPDATGLVCVELPPVTADMPAASLADIQTRYLAAGWAAAQVSAEKIVGTHGTSVVHEPLVVGPVGVLVHATDEHGLPLLTSLPQAAIYLVHVAAPAPADVPKRVPLAKIIDAPASTSGS